MVLESCMDNSQTNVAGELITNTLVSQEHAGTPDTKVDLDGKYVRVFTLLLLSGHSIDMN